MGTKENRIRYSGDKPRYPSDLIDAERPLIEPLIPPAKRGGEYARENYKWRDLIENFFCKLKAFRRIAPVMKKSARALPP